MKDEVSREVRRRVATRSGGAALRPMPGSPVVVPSRLHDAYLFDLDGTVYLGSDLLPGARRLIEELRRWVWGTCT